MFKRIVFLITLLSISATQLSAQDSDFDGVLDGADLCPFTADQANLDTDSDGIGDVCDVDDDNDGILDRNDCEIGIPNYSFENGFFNWTVQNANGNTPLNSISISPANDGPFPGAEGASYLDIEAFGETNSITSSNAFGVYEETGYVFEVALGDLPIPPPPSTVTTNFVDDGLIRLELGYGDNSASFTPVPGAFLDIDGPTQTVEGWNNFSIPFQINAGSPALGEGILIRISHTGIGASELGLGVDFVRLSLDSDGDGISNCKELDSDDDGCFDVVEAGHTDGGSGLLAGAPSLSGDGSVDNPTEGYSGNTNAVLNPLLIACNTIDFDGDGVEDVNDLDDDNDGILDIYDCEIPVLNHSFEDSNPSDPLQEGWVFNSLSGFGGGFAIPNSIDDYYNASDGNRYGFVNGDGTIQQTQVYASYELGSYILSIDVGDGIDYFTNNFRNDGTSTIELGYLDGGGIFNSVNSLIVNPEDTPNGVWTTFTFSTTLTAGDVALGEGIVIRITHTQNNALSQRRGDYDNVSLKRDKDNDGIADCVDPDSDGDGCPDVTEVGHLDNGSGQLTGSGTDVNGLVIGFSSGYTGLRQAYFQNGMNACNIVDTDGDNVINGDRYYFMANGNTAWDEFDLDNDNDGILDVDEGCALTIGGFPEEASNFEQVPNSQLIIVGDPTSQPFASGNGVNGNGVVEFFNASNPAGTGSHLVNAAAYINPNTGQPYSQNYFTDGTLQPDVFDATNTLPSAFNNDQFAFINGDGTLTQLTSFINLEQGGYIISISVGDGLDYENPFRNDGTTLIEAGYGSLTNFNVLTDIFINPEDTPNGTWTDFTINLDIPAGSPAIGQEILLRITHTGNLAANQLAGNYDNIRISRDTDSDGLPDCIDADSDGDGCPDATETGFTNDDNDNFVGNGTPTVDTDGLVTGTNGYVTPVSINVTTPAAPVVIANPFNDEGSCEGGNVTFSIVATRLIGTIVYEWYESTDGGATFTQLTDVAPYSGTATANMTIANVTSGQNNNQYSVRVLGDDYLCYEEATATLTVSPGPSPVTVVASNTNICEGDTAQFELNGDPNDVVTYSFDGGATSSTIILDTAGSAAVSEPTTTNDVTIEILSVEDAVNSCVLTLSPTTSAVVAVNTEPQLTNIITNCAADLLTYDVDFNLNSGTITTSAGTINGNSVEDVPAGTDITITIDNNGCVRSFNITAPNCSCPTIAPPINPLDAAICEGSATQSISVELDPSGLADTINWYDSAAGGSLLFTGLAYDSPETAPGTFTYFAEAEELVSGCVSATRIPVTYTINTAVIADVLPDTTECDSFTLPALSSGNDYYTGAGASGSMLLAGNVITTSQTVYIYASSGTVPNCTDESSFDVIIDSTPALTLTSSVCATDLLTYEVVFQPITGVLTTTAGTVIGNDRVTGIPAGTDVTVTATNNACTSSVTITAPDCSCPPLDQPVNPVNGTVCQGAPNPALSADIPATGGDTINWYDASVGGTLLATGQNYTPSETAPGTYTFYAENFDSATSCTSARIAVELTINAAVIADVLPDTTECDSFTLPALSSGNDYYTGAGASGSMLLAGNVITASQTVYIYASSGTVPNCTDESSFDITIDSTPALTLSSSVCATDLLTYEVVFQPITGVLTTTAGTVIGNDRVTGIPAGTDITVTATNNACTSSVTITAPDCSCPPLDQPVNPVNGTACQGAPNPALSADIPATGGDTINWYDASVGGTLLATGQNYTPSETAPGTYTFYAENFDSATSCTSVRIAVSFTVSEVLVIDPIADVEACEVYILPDLGSNISYSTGPNGTGSIVPAGQTVTTSQMLFVQGTAPGNANCITETSFEITILQEPILDLPTALSLCPDENGSVQSEFIGADLGPNFRYDWTPDNDINGDGIEEPILEVTQSGTYTLQIFQIGTTAECGGAVTYTVLVEEGIQPTEVNTEVTSSGAQFGQSSVRVIPGDDPLLFNEFEYSLTGPNGPFQTQNIFTNVEGGLYKAYVRAISGCGPVIESEPFLLVNYPTFFTPNGDGSNEVWQPFGLENLNITRNVEVHIFDRYGKLIATLDPMGPGWDGTYNGIPMTATDYWFKINYIDELAGERIQLDGHFSLVR